ncbi:hypothetical protein [Thermanaeromonas toyohensis]|uniref:hypothetical protein n=1 Tax=Thermanaeromonas toyohensis TaxID=161154 RepID=UPI001560B648|nr:hypothetical protein [Thermanaeromonas toyohensis]
MAADIYLGSATSLEALLYACRILSRRLSSWLKERNLVWQRITVCLDTEERPISVSREFTRAQPPENICLHLQRIISGIQAASPVEKISVTLDWLGQAPVSQLAIFDGKDTEREDRLRKAVAAASRAHSGILTRASDLAPSRRELMLSFYDPWRSSIRDTGAPGSLAQTGKNPAV